MKSKFILSLCVWLGTVLLALFGVGCQASESAKPAVPEITVSAAASLQDVFREIGKQFEAQRGARINFNFAASGTLQKQIESGAPVDVFASAGHAQIDALAAQGLIAPETRRDFARNVLVLIAPAGQSVELKSFADLNTSRIKRIAIGNPKTVPAGQYAEQTLKHFNLWTPLQSRLVLGEDVRQVLDYVTRGEVEAGIVYASDVRARGGAVQIVTRAPADSHEPIAYPIAVILASKQAGTARAFLDAVLSDEGQRSLEKYGYERIK